MRTCIEQNIRISENLLPQPHHLSGNTGLDGCSLDGTYTHQYLIQKKVVKKEQGEVRADGRTESRK